MANDDTFVFIPDKSFFLDLINPDENRISIATNDFLNHLLDLKLDGKEKILFSTPKEVIEDVNKIISKNKYLKDLDIAGIAASLGEIQETEGDTSPPQEESVIRLYRSKKKYYKRTNVLSNVERAVYKEHDCVNADGAVTFIIHSKVMHSLYLK